MKEKRVMATLRRDDWKKLKHYAAEKEMPLQAVVDEAVGDFIDRAIKKEDGKCGKECS